MVHLSLGNCSGVNRWREIDRQVRRIAKLDAYRDRLTRREACDIGYGHIPGSRKIVCGVCQQDIRWHPQEYNLEGATNRAAADIAEVNTPVECRETLDLVVVERPPVLAPLG